MTNEDRAATVGKSLDERDWLAEIKFMHSKAEGTDYEGSEADPAHWWITIFRWPDIDCPVEVEVEPHQLAIGLARCYELSVERAEKIRIANLRRQIKEYRKMITERLLAAMEGQEIGLGVPSDEDTQQEVTLLEVVRDNLAAELHRLNREADARKRQGEAK